MNAWKFAKVQKKYTQVLYTGVQVTAQEDLVVLGASTGSAALESTVEEKTQVFQAFSQKLQRIDAHYAWFLIKNCLYMPRLLYVLRTSPCFKLCENLQRIDNYLRASFESICNVSLSESRDKQVFLPVKLGGMCMPSAVLTAPSAFLASAVGCEPLSQNLNLNLWQWQRCRVRANRLVRAVNGGRYASSKKKPRKLGPPLYLTSYK